MIESHPLVKLARQTIETFIRQGVTLAPPQDLTADMEHRAGAFVTIRRHGKLRGCIGTIQPTCENVAAEVIQNAISAATRDPRFPRLSPDELDDIEVKVDVLGEPERVHSLDELDPRRYGLIIQSKLHPIRRGLLLPDLKGIDTVEDQVYHTRYFKAQITDPEEPVEMFRFEVKRYS